MTSLSIADCCQMLGIDPKTLRQWLAQAQMSLHAHPTDARFKCLTSEQVNLLANLHGRVLQPSGFASLRASPKPDETESRSPTPVSLPDLDLRERLVQMETQVATLQAQVATLSLQLLQERASRTEQRLLALETQLPSAFAFTTPRSDLSYRPPQWPEIFAANFQTACATSSCSIS